eukprot:3794747-Amphidinium_carterae.1
MGRSSAARSVARATSHEEKLKEKKDKKEKKTSRERDGSDDEDGHTEVVSPASPPAPASVPSVVPGASPKRQPKTSNPVAQEMDVDVTDSGAKRARSSDSHPVAPPNATLDDKVDLLLRCMPDLSRMTLLIESQNQKLDKHTKELDDVKARLARLESTRGGTLTTPAAKVAAPAVTSLPTPPPPPVAP